MRRRGVALIQTVLVIAIGSLVGVGAFIAVNAQSGTVPLAMMLEAARPAQAGTIVTDNCLNPIPATLRCRVLKHPSPQYVCAVDGLTATLTYQGAANPVWRGTGTLNGITLQFVFGDAGGSGFTLNIRGCNPGPDGATEYAYAVGGYRGPCQPFVWTRIFNDGGICGPSPFQVVID